MHESSVIAAFIHDRSSYEQAAPFLKQIPFSDVGSIVYKEIGSFYEKDISAKQIDLDLILSDLKRKYPKRYKLFDEYLLSLPNEVSIPNVLDYLRKHLQERKGLDIIQALSANSEDAVSQLMEEYLELSENLLEDGSKCYNSVSMDELNIQLSTENLIPIYPSKLNSVLGGGLPKQSQVAIFARPNVGKSTMCTNLAFGAANNGFRVAYFGNEDADARMLLRFLCRFSDKTIEEVKKDPETAFTTAMANGYSNMYFIPLHPGTMAEIRTHIERIKPDVVIVDQIRNLNVVKDNMVINLEQAVIRLRNLAKEFDFVSIVVTQAGESATGKLHLEMNDIEWSNTGVAAQMDLMVGIGQNRDLRMNHRAVLSFPKSKFTDILDPIPVKLDYQRNKILA
jgi:archaellum biogenesis ATPase FlaH